MGEFNYTNMIEKLYSALNCSEIHGNPFETSENTRIFNMFYEKYIEKMDFDSENECHLDLVKLTETERKTAFIVGFKTAINLIVA